MLRPAIRNVMQNGVRFAVLGVATKPFTAPTSLYAEYVAG